MVVLNWLTKALRTLRRPKKQTKSAGNVPSGSRLVVTTSLLRDIAVPYNHPADVAAVEALKVKKTMCDRVQDTVDTVIMMNWT